MGKIIVCHCEDVTAEDIHTALAQGYGDIESLKRYTGIGTGKCQGKCCLLQTLRELRSPRGVHSAAAGRAAGPGELLGPPDESRPDDLVRIPTIRQPATPVTIDDLARSVARDPEGDR